jgi:hypothetical protein
LALSCGTTSSILNVERLCSEASRLIEAGDFSTAENKLVAAQAMLASLPVESTKGGNAGTSMTWNPETINALLANVRRLAANASAKALQSSGGLVLMPLSLRPARCSGV